MKQELDRYKHRFKKIIGALPCSYIYGDVFVNGKGDPTDYAVRDVNHAFTVVTGLSRDKALGKRIAGLFSMASVQEDIQVFARVALTGDPVEKEFLSPYFGMNFRLFCFSPEKGSFVALLTDLSAEKKYRERIEFLSDFTNSTSDEFFILDQTGRFVFGNRAVSEKLGEQQSRVPGMHLSRLNTLAEEKWWSTLWNSLLQKGSLQFETEHRGSRGDLYPVELSIDLMVNGKQRYAAVVAKNISSKRALSSALLKDQRYAEKAASTAGYSIWMIDSANHFRPILGGDGSLIPGLVDSVFFPLIHPAERESLSGRIKTEAEGSFDFRMKTQKGYVYHRAVWSRVEDDCTAGICYPLSGAGLSGQGSGSSAMDTYCLMVEAVYRKTVKLKEAIENEKPGTASRIVNSITSEFSGLTGQSVFPERVRFDAFLHSSTGMLKQLLEPSIPLEIDSSLNAAGLIDPTFLENILVRLLLIVQKTERAQKVVLQSLSFAGDAGIRMTVYGSEGIQSELDRFFIPVRDSMPGLASVYAMVRSAGGKVDYETKDSRVEFNIWFPRAKMSDEEASILIALPDTVDAARSYAALRDAGFSAAIETNCEEIRRRMGEEGAGILVASASMPDFVPCELVSGLEGITLVQIGGKPPGGNVRYLPDGFRTGELVFLVKEIISKAEKPQVEDLQGGILWAEPHLTPPLL